MFSSIQLKIFGVATALLLLGYVLLAQGPANNPLSMNVAPLVLIGVYCVIIPFAIVFKGKNKDQQQKKGV